MTTTYRVVVHCDGRRGPDCHGLVEFRDGSQRVLEGVTAAVRDRGWLRGYWDGGTFDVCPACRPLVEAERTEQEAPK